MTNKGIKVLTHSLMYQNSKVLPEVLETWKFVKDRSRVKSRGKLEKLNIWLSIYKKNNCENQSYYKGRTVDRVEVEFSIYDRPKRSENTPRCHHACYDRPSIRLQFKSVKPI